MIYKNNDNVNVIQFGTGDIEVADGRVSTNSGTEMYPCVCFNQSHSGEIGRITRPEMVGKPAELRSDVHTMFVFTNIKSFDVVIDAIKKAKERFEINGPSVFTPQEITDGPFKHKVT